MSSTDRMAVLKRLDNKTKCPECHNWNNCAIEVGKSPSSCWCFSVQAKENIEEGNTCLCKPCLRK